MEISPEVWLAFRRAGGREEGLEAVAPLIHNAAIEAAAQVADREAYTRDGFSGSSACMVTADNIRALAEPLPQQQERPDAEDGQ